jgi:hypothetical protein
MIRQFLNIQNIVSIFACVGVFFMATKIESCSNKKELNRLDKKIASLQEQRQIDSTKIANADAQIFDLQQSLDASKGNDLKLQLVIKEQLKMIKQLQNDDNSCCAELKHLEETGNIRYFVKKPLSKWYEEVFEKPKYIK